MHKIVPASPDRVERLRLGDVVTEHDKRWRKQCIIRGRGGVIKGEEVRAGGDGDVEGKGLIEVAKIWERV